MKTNTFITTGLAILPLAFLGGMVIAPLWAMLNYQDAALLWRELLADDYYQRRILWTIFQAAATVCMTLLLALPVGWALARLDFVGKRWLLRGLMLPFVLPTLVVAMGVLALFGERGVLWRGWADTAYLLLYGNVFFNLPVMIRAAYQGFLAVPRHQLALAKLFGANVWQRFWWIEWAVLKNGLLGAACLVFLYCFSGFGLALLLGGRRYATIEVEIYQLIAHELDMSRASVLVWCVLAITALASGLSAWLNRPIHAAKIQTVQPEKPRGWQQKSVLWLAWAIVLLVEGLPLLAIVFQAARAGEAWRVWLSAETWLAVKNTVGFTLCAVVLATVFGVCHAAVARQWLWLRGLMFLPMMISPVCLAFGVLLLYPDWSASLWLLLGLYALMAYPFVAKDVLTAWDNLPPCYISVARVGGATRFQAARYVLMPLLRPALRRGMTVAAATCVGEFAATLFLSRPEWLTLTTLIYQKLGKVGAYPQALVLALGLMMLSVVIFALIDSDE